MRVVLEMALLNALKLVTGLRKQIGDLDGDVIVGKLLDELQLSSLRGRDICPWR